MRPLQASVEDLLTWTAVKRLPINAVIRVPVSVISELASFDHDMSIKTYLFIQSY